MNEELEREVLVMCNLSQGVRWCTATKWSGGYEADTPFKDGLMLILVDAAGAEIGMEVTYQTKWNGQGLADKEFPFSWEIVPEYPRE